jgi:hypothetical protein
MKITKHISFYYIPERFQYINKIIKETNTYNYKTDIFIHTNVNFSLDFLTNYDNGSINIIVHDLTNTDPYYLTWMCRDLLKEQKNNYDIFMYIEDDILVKKEAIEYWLKYKNNVLENNYNLGFFRIEIDDKGYEYTSDNSSSPDGKVEEYLTNSIEINNEKYIINNKNPYCAFWIYDKNEFQRFVESNYYNINNIIGYHIREASAIGLHGLHTDWYNGTVIPLENNKLHKSSRIYHLPNNYINKENGWKLHLFEDVVRI